MLYAKSTGPYKNGSIKCLYKWLENIWSLYPYIPGTQLMLNEISVLMHDFICTEAGVHGLGCHWSESIHVSESLSLSEDLFLSQTKR